MDLNNKRILFFSPRFFGFEEKIKEKLISMGASVDYYDDRPSNSFWGKAFLRVSNTLMRKSIKKYYKRIEDDLDNIKQYDYVFLLNLEAMPISFLKKLREKYSTARILLYMWDSVRRKKHTIGYQPYCDRMFTFDREDIKTYDLIEFLPLFYIDDYSRIAEMKDYKYDLCFVGSAHTDRYAIVNKVLNQMKSKKIFIYWFLQGRMLYLYYRLYNVNFRHSKMSDFNYKPLPTEDLVNYIAQSKVVLDIHSPHQSGLTMRTIETLGAKRKLITTNQDIVEYDFFNPSNILIIDRINPVINEDFFSRPYEQIDDAIYYKYSISGWIEQIFKDNRN